MKQTSLEIICRNWVFGPLRAKKEPMMNKQPSVKEMANFCGNSTITGRNMKKAINMKKTPAAVMMAKHMTACLDGTKLAAACTFPGNSLTPFVTLSTQIRKNHHCFNTQSWPPFNPNKHHFFLPTLTTTSDHTPIPIPNVGFLFPHLLF